MGGLPPWLINGGGDRWKNVIDFLRETGQNAA